MRAAGPGRKAHDVALAQRALAVRRPRTVGAPATTSSHSSSRGGSGTGMPRSPSSSSYRQAPIFSEPSARPTTRATPAIAVALRRAIALRGQEVDLAHRGTLADAGRRVTFRRSWPVALRTLAAARLLGRAAGVGEVATGVLEMGAHEPVELLERLGLLDQEGPGDGIDDRSRHRVAVRCDHSDVDLVERAEMRGHEVAAEAVVVPLRCFTIVPAGRRGCRRRRDPLCDLVDHLVHARRLRIEHRVHPDEVRADDVPVDVLERQPQIDERDEAGLEDADELLARPCGPARPGGT